MIPAHTRAPAVLPTTIFIVDDDDNLRRALARLIRSAGWNVETFASGQEFLARAPYTGTGCLVLDVQMPGMTGPELHAQMPSRDIVMPVIFLTGHGDVPTGVHAIKSGAVDFLAKPVDDEVLLETVRRGIERDAVEQAARLRRRDVDARLARLSPREHEVLEYVIGGHLNKQIADRMGISLKTVKAHRAQVMAKMDVESLATLVHLCEIAEVPVRRRQPDPRSSA